MVHIANYRAKRIVASIGRARAQGRQAAAAGLGYGACEYDLYSKHREQWIQAFDEEMKRLEWIRKGRNLC